MITQYSQAQIALGGDIILTITCDNAFEQKCEQHFKALWQMIFEFERQFSRFLPKSELTLFNNAAGQKVRISEEFLAVLRIAKNLSIQTNELFNPFILPALQRAGYINSFAPGYENDVQVDYSKRQLTSINNLDIGETWARIPYGTALDLGGCGKGFLADMLAECSQKKWIQGFWFSVGGDIVGEGLDGQSKPWVIQIYSPLPSDTKRTYNTDGSRFAAATSSTSVRAGKKWHHIIDPTTQKPAKSDVNFASIFMKSAVEADVLASCAIILGSNYCMDFLAEQGVSAAVIRGSLPKNKPFELTFGSAVHILETQYV